MPLPSLRNDSSANQWMVLDSEADSPQPLTQHPCTGSVHVLTRVDSEAEFLPEWMRTRVSPTDGMYHLIVIGPLHAVMGDMGAATWLQAQPVPTLRTAASHATSVALVSDTCIKISLPAPIATSLLPTAMAVRSLSVALRKHCSCTTPASTHQHCDAAVRLYSHSTATTVPKPKPYMKWRVDRFLDN